MSDRSKQVALCLLASCLGAIICRPLFGLDRDVQIDQLHHTVWTDEDAGIGEIKQVVQTTDGFLWLKTSTGHLLRFDGSRFEAIETAIPSLASDGEHTWDDIYSIATAPNGGLWIGHGHPRLDFLQNGEVRRFTIQNGLPNLPIDRLIPDLDGALWMATQQGLGRLQGGRCSQVGADWGYSGGTPVALFVDRSGTLWVKSHDGRLFFLLRGAKAFSINASGSGMAEPEGYLAQSPDGNIWQSGKEGLHRVLQGRDDRTDRQTYRSGPSVEGLGILFDRDGALWYGMPDGLHRIPHPEELESLRSNPRRQSPAESTTHLKGRLSAGQAFTVKQGLSSDLIWSLFEDREGNIWAGTSGGLDRFRNNSFIRVPIPPTRREQFALAAGDQGTVWAANWDSPLFHLGDQLLSTHKFMGEYISALYRDPSGAIWVGKFGKSLSRSTRNGLVNVGWPAGQAEDYVKAMAMDRDGGLWVSLATRGIYRLANGVWARKNEQLLIPNGAAVEAMTVDDRGRIWFNMGALTVLDGDNVQKFDSRNGIAKGYATAVSVSGSRIWMGGLYGLALFINGRFRTITGSDGDVFAAVTGIIELPNRDLWINTAAGVTRIRASEVERAVHEPAYRVQFDRFDAQDGLEGKATYWIPVPTAIRGLDGKLWFSTNRGVFRADPEEIARRENPLPPPVVVNSITSAGKRFAISDTIRLPVYTENVQIDYTALSLTIPERERFRYRLEGVDQQWQDAGTRRQAFYTRLSPATYQFRVIACNNDGVWNETGATIRFVIAASWYQTLSFRCLCVVAFLCGLWSLYAVRLAMATAEINDRLNERLKERERIARDLHDTLLQGFNGIMLRFQAVLKQIPKDQRAHGTMEEALNRADEVLLEGRERVRSLRFVTPSSTALQEALETCGRELSQDHKSEFSISTVGSPRILKPIVQDEVFQIAREALSNAFRHSKASKIEVEITYTRREFQLRIRDDGDGMDPTVAETGRPGHWGILGMRERANQAGGQLRIWSSRGTGVEVDFVISGNVAYLPAHETPFSRNLQSAFKRRGQEK